MLDDFLVRALLAGIGVALAAGPIGCFVLWRRMAYFGTALAHSALLGVALGFLLEIDLSLGIVVVCVLLGLAVTWLERVPWMATDTLLGVLAHVALAAGVVMVSFLEGLRVDLLGYLFGDVLAVSVADLGLIYLMAVTCLALLAWRWRALISITVNEQLAALDGVRVERERLLLTLTLAFVIAFGMKVVGMLLVLSLLIIPAASVRRFSASPTQMAAAAAGAGAVAVATGLLLSLELDVPAGPAIVLAAALLFLVGHVVPSTAAQGTES